MNRNGSRAGSGAACWILTLVFLAGGNVFAQSAPIEYTIALHQPQTQMVEIAMRVRNVTTPSLEVALPVWRPGRYAVIDPAGTVRDVTASGSGRVLPIEKIDKTTWRITSEGLEEVEVRYRIYANSLADRTRHVDDTHAFLSGSTVFFYVPGRRNDEILVRIDAPEDWRVATGLEPVDSDPRLRRAASYDVLIDSPLEIGLHEVLTFDVDGKPHEIVIWGEADYDGERLKSDFADIVRSQAAMFGDMPYDRYVFLLHVSTSASGGTEHLNSTIMQAPPRSLEDDDAYKRFLGLVSHEMFHTWNVKQLRPAGISPYEYAGENYTKLLWVSEGTTSYYDDLTLARIGAVTPDEYLKTMSETIDSLRKRPGLQVQSVEESSFDAWIKFTRPNPDSVNSTVSFYTGGAMASFLIDSELRRRTGNGASLDDVMRQLYERFPLSGPGFTPEDLIATLDALSESSFAGFYDRYIRGTETYPLEESVRALGLELVFAPAFGDGEGEEVEEKAYAGVNLSTRDGAAVVDSVLSDGPAYLAGIMPGDRIVALDDRQVTAAGMESEIGRRAPGDTVRLHLFRHGRLRVVDLRLDGKPDGRWRLRRAEEPTSSEQQAYESWIGQPWPSKPSP